MSKKKRVETNSGSVIEVDISDEACGKFCSESGIKFKHGDRIRQLFSDKEEGVVEGVAPSWEGARNVLWYALDCRNGKVSYSLPQYIDLV